MKIGKKIEKQDFEDRRSSRDSSRRNQKSNGRNSFSKNFESEGDGSKLFINLGSVDGFNRNALAEFISAETSVDKANIKKVKLFEKHSFVEIDHKFTDRVIKSFKNKNYKGHKLRVNHE
mgnify:CR=1 FL=1